MLVIAFNGLISTKAKIEGFLENNATIIGPSVIKKGTFIGEAVIIGYPLRKKVLNMREKPSFETFDDISKGALIGIDCMIRSGSIIYEGTQIGDRVETGHGVLIREKTKIGDGTRIGTHAVIDGNVQIGSNCNIQTGAYLPPGTVIGSNVFIGPYVTITNDRYPPSPKVSGVTIGGNAAIGSRATLIAGIKIGEGTVVGAGAVVTKDIPPKTVVLGVPARRIMSREEYNQKQRDFLA